MTKTQKQAAELRAKPLFDFLDCYDARLISKLSAEQGSAKGSAILLYLVNTHLVIVTIDVDGWEIFLPASKRNDIADTLKQAEDFLGARPGDGHLKVAASDTMPVGFYPQTGAIYRSNYSGLLYEVLMVARQENGEGLMVVFQPEDRTIPRGALLEQFGKEFSYVNNLGFKEAR